LFYNEKTIYYRCELRFEDNTFQVIKNLLIGILGKPKSAGILHQFIVVNMENGEEAGEGFQLTLTSEKLAELQNQCKALNISFEEVFKRDWRHFHINCYVSSDEHVGIAFEHEDYWNIYYEDGTFLDLPNLRDNDYLITKIMKKDIFNVDNDITNKFEMWVKENIDIK
jgi:hypothetical protein